MSKKTIISILVGFPLIFLLFQQFYELFTLDIVTSLIPGWHTVIDNARYLNWGIFVLFIMTISVILAFIVKKNLRSHKHILSSTLGLFLTFLLLDIFIADFVKSLIPDWGIDFSNFDIEGSFKEKLYWEIFGMFLITLCVVLSYIGIRKLLLYLWTLSEEKKLES